MKADIYLLTTIPKMERNNIFLVDTQLLKSGAEGLGIDAKTAQDTKKRTIFFLLTDRQTNRPALCQQTACKRFTCTENEN